VLFPKLVGNDLRGDAILDSQIRRTFPSA
jgi:hypothetical protein